MKMSENYKWLQILEIYIQTVSREEYPGSSAKPHSGAPLGPMGLQTRLNQ